MCQGRYPPCLLVEDAPPTSRAFDLLSWVKGLTALGRSPCAFSTSSQNCSKKLFLSSGLTDVSDGLVSLEACSELYNSSSFFVSFIRTAG